MRNLTVPSRKMLLSQHFNTLVSWKQSLRCLLAFLSLWLLAGSALQAQTIVDAAGAQLQFTSANRVAGQTGFDVGHVVRYNNVLSVGGVTVYAEIETTAKISGTSFTTYDSTSNPTTNNAYFQPLFSDNGSGNTDQSVTFEFSFYDQNDDPVTLLNLYVNSYDIDFTQYQNFSGFDSYSLSSDTNFTGSTGAVTLETDGSVTFSDYTGTNNQNNSDAYRVRVFYQSIDVFTVTIGDDDGSIAYFGLDFSIGVVNWNGNPPVVTPTPARNITFTPNIFNEVAADTGAIDNTIVFTLNNASGASFSNGIEIGAAGGVTVSNIPGLTPVITRDSATQVTLTLNGTATDNDDADDIGNYSVIFGDNAFTGTTASTVTNSSITDIEVDYIESSNTSPSLDNPIGDETLVYGAGNTFSFPANTFSDLEDSSLDYTTSTLPTGITFVPGTRTFTVAGTVGVGTYPVTVTATDDDGATAADTFNISVTKAVLTVTGDDDSIVNGAAIPALSATISGFVNGENLGTSGVTGTPGVGTTATVGAGVGNYPITPSVGTLASANYSFTYVDGNLEMTNNDPVLDPNVPGSVQPTGGIPDQTETYGTGLTYTFPAGTFTDEEDGTALTYAVTSILPSGIGFTPNTNNGTFTVAGTVPAGTYSITVRATDSNGGFVEDTFDIVITKAVLTVTGDDDSIVNGAAIPALSATITGFVNGENLGTSGVTGTPAVTTTATVGAGIGNYPITPSVGTLASSNYSFNYVAGNLEMTNSNPVLDPNVPGSVQPTGGIPDQTETYGTGLTYTFPAGTFTDEEDGTALTYAVTSSLPTGITFTPNTNDGTFTVAATVPAGTYTITVRATDSNGGFVEDTFDIVITKAVLTVTGDDDSIVNGAAIPALSATISGFVNSENLGTSGVTGTPGVGTTATVGAGVGNYPITPSVGTLASANYSFTYVDGNLEMTNNDPVLDPNVPGSVQPTGGIPDQTETYGTGLTYTFPAGTFTDEEDGTALTYSVTSSLPTGITFTPNTNDGTFTVAATVPAGTYTITVRATDSNGGFVEDTFDIVITKAVLTVTGDDDSIVNGAAIPALSATITGFVNGENLGTSGVTGTPAVTTTGTQGAEIGNYPITPSVGTLASANYSFTYVDGNLEMTNNDPVLDPNVPGSVQPTGGIPDQTRTYGTDINYTFPVGTFTDNEDGTTMTYTVTGVPTGVTFTPGTDNGSFTGQPDAGVGTYAVTVRATDSHGAFVESTFDIIITKAVLTVTGDDETIIDGAAIPSPLTATISGFVNGETLETSDVEGEPDVTTTATAASGLGTYPIIPTVGTLDSDNYSFSYENGILEIVNNPPVNAVPAGVQFAENLGNFIFNTENGNSISVYDPDGTDLTVTLSVEFGTLTLAQITGLSFVDGTQNGEAVVTVSGSQAAINAALEGLAYKSLPEFAGEAAEVLEVHTVDPGGLSDTDEVRITVQLVALGNLPSESIDTLRDRNRTLVSVTPETFDDSLIREIVVNQDGEDWTMAVVPIGGQNGDVYHTVVEIRLTYSDSFTEIVEIPVVIYHPILELLVEVDGELEVVEPQDADESVFVLNHATGFYEQKVRVLNPTPFNFKSVRIFVDDFPAGLHLRSSAGELDGVEYVEWDVPILAGEERELIIEYFSTTRVIDGAPTLQLLLELFPLNIETPEGAVPVPLALGVSKQKRYQLEFVSEVGHTYYIEYTSDLTAGWTTSTITMEGNGEEIIWVDDGPPKTVAPTAVTPQRFYRIFSVSDED